MSESFFSKEKVHNFIWFLIGAFVLFICGLIWTNIYGPNEVKVISDGTSKPDTTITIVKFESQNEQSKVPANSIDISDLDSTIRTAIAEEYRLQIALSTNKESSESVNESLDPSIITPPEVSLQESNSNQKLNTTLESVYVNASINRPKFELPKIVEGYAKGNLNSFGRIFLNKSQFNQEDIIVLGVEFFDSKMVDRITPVYVELLEKTSENTYYLHWNEQYEMKGLKNRIRFSAGFPKKNYELETSFYIKTEIDQKFPTRYSKKFNIEII